MLDNSIDKQMSSAREGIYLIILPGWFAFRGQDIFRKSQWNYWVLPNVYVRNLKLILVFKRKMEFLNCFNKFEFNDKLNYSKKYRNEVLHVIYKWATLWNARTALYRSLDLTSNTIKNRSFAFNGLKTFRTHVPSVLVQVKRECFYYE